MNSKMKNVNVSQAVEQSLQRVQDNPCCVCPYDGMCGINYKRACKIARGIKRAIRSIKK